MLKKASQPVFDILDDLDHQFDIWPDSIEYCKHSLGYWIEDANRLAKNNKGRLPSYAWLKSNGRNGMLHAMRKYPETFAHFERDFERCKLNDMVVIAQDIADKNGGLLPNTSKLRKMGHGNLVTQMYCAAERFAHIPKEKSIMSLDEHVRSAEKLSKQYQGLLPGHRWLRRNGFTALSGAMTKWPLAFRHIRRQSEESPRGPKSCMGSSL